MSLGKSILWVFCLGSGPFCVSGLLFLLMKRKSGRGFAGRLARLWVLFVWCDLPSFLDLFGPCTKCCFTAYAHVRTEPQCDIGHTREKKRILCFFMTLDSIRRLEMQNFNFTKSLVGVGRSRYTCEPMGRVERVPTL